MSNLSTERKLVIIDPDSILQAHLPGPERFVFRTGPTDKDRLRETFLILHSDRLAQHSHLIDSTVKPLRKLQIFFIVLDTDLDDLLDELAELRVGPLLPKILCLRDIKQVNRVMEAWLDGLQEFRIADTRVSGTTLKVKGCDLARYELDLATMPVLKHLSKSELSKTTIDPPGTRLTWKDGIDLDFDTIRYQCDPDHRHKANLAAISYYPNFGEGIRQVRETSALTQEDVTYETGLSTRHLSRIENSEQRPTQKLINKLAAVHELDVSEYVSRITQACADMETNKASRKKSPSTKRSTQKKRSKTT